MTPEVFTKWENEATSSGRVISYYGDDNTKYLIDASLYPKKFEELIQLIIYNPDQYNSLSETDRDNKLFSAEILAEAGKFISAKEQTAIKFLKNRETAVRVNELVQDFEYFRKSSNSDNYDRTEEEEESGSSIVVAVINFFKSIFSRESKTEAVSGNKEQNKKTGKKSGKTVLSKNAKDIYKQIKNKPSIIAVISDFIEIKPETEKMIDQLIAEIRSSNIKIVIPIFNARQVLYPVRSKKYLVADVDYVLVDPEVPRSPEAIREFTDSITGYKFKEDVITGNALFQIEKYLMTIYRQNRAKMKRKKK
jgi:ABC-type lipopolysaccharide export system ATPase subunit